MFAHSCELPQSPQAGAGDSAILVRALCPCPSSAPIGRTGNAPPSDVDNLQLALDRSRIGIAPRLKAGCAWMRPLNKSPTPGSARLRGLSHDLANLISTVRLSAEAVKRAADAG